MSVITQSENPQTYELMVCAWEKSPRHCVYLNNYRIAGRKPWGGASQHTAWNITLNDIANAIPAIHGLLGVLKQVKQGAEYPDELGDLIDAAIAQMEA